MRAFLLGASALAALPAAALGTAAPAAAQQDPDLVRNTLSTLGIIEEQKPNIQYRERAPLVVPPPTAADGLPQPQAAASTKLPNWPKDPDVQRAQQAKSVDNSPVMRYEDKRDVLLPSELNKGRKAKANAIDGPVGADSKRDVMLPSELGFKSWFGITPSDEKPLAFNGEPERESLTQPPPGYQTPAPNAPYGVVEKKNEPFKFPTLFDRQ
ncbi:hypothetical protein [Azorhizobium doebereinerae]|uniref:hypothetical protein n=1 Tax=Azorhizobium doebereinerae TaxID=281091 RepID=UPI0012EC9083|nr:hypothetical protein [Azorhizobium doebereinerae]